MKTLDWKKQFLQIMGTKYDSPTTPSAAFGRIPYIIIKSFAFHIVLLSTFLLKLSFRNVFVCRKKAVL